MKLSFLQSLILGLLSGLAEVLPVSGQAHRLVLLKMQGLDAEPAVLRLMIHMGIVFALYFYCKGHIVRMMRAQRLVKIPKNRRKRPLDTDALMDFNLLKTTLIPTVLGFLLYGKVSSLAGSLLYVAGFLLLNGIVLYVPQYFPGSNKQSGALSRIDSLFFGLGGAMGTLPGVSSVGCAVSIGSVRGMDLSKALNLALVMNIPINMGFAFFDLMNLLKGGAGSISFGSLIFAAFAGAAAFFGVIVGIRLLKKIVENVGYSVFGFYSWGAALLTFILYLAAA